MFTTDLPGDRPRRVVLIGDSEPDRRRLRSRLAADQLFVREASDGPAGLAACLAEAPDLILIDLGRPGGDASAVLRALKGDSRTLGLPVIVISATAGPDEKAHLLDAGAVDVVTRPYDLVELRARIRVALRTKRYQDMLERRAYVDGLTGLSNRLALEDRLATEWGLHQRHGGELALWVADLDHFKRVNDTYGHAAGDKALRHAAAVLRATVRTTDMAARYGGEEFVVIAPHCGLAGATRTADRFREQMASSVISLDDGASFRVTVSVGVASVPEVTADSPGRLLTEADLALYQAKSHGRDRVTARLPASPVEASSRNGWVLTRS